MTNKCELTPLTAATKAEMKKTTQQLQAEALGITEQRLTELQAYAVKLRFKFPHMKEDRLRRKVAEYFKIKLT